MGGPSGPSEQSRAAHPAPAPQAAPSHGERLDAQSIIEARPIKDVTPGLCVTQDDAWIPPADVQSARAPKSFPGFVPAAQVTTDACQALTAPSGDDEGELR